MTASSPRTIVPRVAVKSVEVVDPRTLVPLDAETVIDSGAFSGAVLAVSAVFLGSMYKWPSFDIRGSEVLTHKPSVAAYRAPGSPIATSRPVRSTSIPIIATTITSRRC